MKTIFKYSLVHGTNYLSLPQGSVILTAGMQYGQPQLWVLLDQSKPSETRQFQIYGTGFTVPDRVSYIATLFEGPYVWHVMEVFS